MDNDTPECRRCREEWRALLQGGVSLASLQGFYARYKYLVMSRQVTTYHAIGTLLAQATNQSDLQPVAQRVYELIMSALVQTPARGGVVNVLMHIAGYLKQQLSREEKHKLLDTIERYARGELEFEAPATLLREHFQRFPNPYIEQQVFLYPSTRH